MGAGMEICCMWIEVVFTWLCTFFKTHQTLHLKWKHFVVYKFYYKTHFRASLVAQWLRIRLPMQGTRVRALVREDPTCHEATKPVRHNY